jgi:dienelactone hydrolase
MTLDRAGLRRLIATGAPETQRPVEVRRGSVSVRQGVDIERIELVAHDRVVPALLMTTTPPPWPAAVVAVHQHNGRFDLGKSEPAGLAGDPEMAYGIRVAAMGIPVIAPDLHGFEERSPSHGDPAVAEQRTAWELVASGRTLQGGHSDDVSLAVTWLAENQDVTGPIGVIGHSLGGQVSLFTMAVDPRIRAGVISCGVGTIASFGTAGIFHNPAYYVPGLVSAGDLPAVAACTSGQSIRLLAGDHDPLFPRAGVDAVAAALDPARSEILRFPGGHAFPLIVQQPAIDWLARTLIYPASGTPTPGQERIT